MSMYKQFESDQNAEQNGIVLDYQTFRVTVARAGGSNKKFQKTLEAVTRPYLRAIKTETIDPDKANELMIQTYADSIILGWETLRDGQWVRGIESKDGELLPFTKANVAATLTALPNLYDDIREQAANAVLFRLSTREAAAGN